MNNPQGVITSELAQAKLLRAIYSERQLEEVMTDFWFNHFNVFVEKGLDRIMLTSYERDVIRPHALGKFEDLLVATAKSPAMLFYLDNWLSVGPDSAQALGIPAHPGPYERPYQRRPNQGKRPSGLNENYGRELLELHTLSVNGGYSQRDVTEVAKVFTGWTIEKPAQGGGFKFDPRMHEPGPKFVLGHQDQAQGRRRGLGSAAPAGDESADRAFHFAEAGGAFCVGRSAAGVGRPHGENVLEKERRHPRGAEHAVPFARILGRRNLPRQSENAPGIRGLGGASHRRRG